MLDETHAASNAFLIFAGFLAGLTLILLVVIQIFQPGQNNLALDASIASFTMGVLTFFKVQQTHILVNSELTKFKEQTKLFERNIGREEGRVTQVAQQKQDDKEAIDVAREAASVPRQP